MYVTIDRKTQNELDIQKSANGKLGIMIHLKFVKINTQNEVDHQYQDENGLFHRKNILQDLVKPLAKRGGRIVCTGSYFDYMVLLLEINCLGFYFKRYGKYIPKTFYWEDLSV